MLNMSKGSEEFQKVESVVCIRSIGLNLLLLLLLFVVNLKNFPTFTEESMPLALVKESLHATDVFGLEFLKVSN